MESHLFQLFSKDGIENIRKYTFRNLEDCTKEEEEKIGDVMFSYIGIVYRGKAFPKVICLRKIVKFNLCNFFFFFYRIMYITFAFCLIAAHYSTTLSKVK